jgi:hypothetical protein
MSETGTKKSFIGWAMSKVPGYVAKNMPDALLVQLLLMAAHVALWIVALVLDSNVKDHVDFNTAPAKYELLNYAMIFTIGGLSSVVLGLLIGLAFGQDPGTDGPLTLSLIKGFLIASTLLSAVGLLSTSGTDASGTGFADTNHYEHVGQAVASIGLKVILYNLVASNVSDARAMLIRKAGGAVSTGPAPLHINSYIPEVVAARFVLRMNSKNAGLLEYIFPVVGMILHVVSWGLSIVLSSNIAADAHNFNATSPHESREAAHHAYSAAFLWSLIAFIIIAIGIVFGVLQMTMNNSMWKITDQPFVHSVVRALAIGALVSSSVGAVFLGTGHGVGAVTDTSLATPKEHRMGVAWLIWSLSIAAACVEENIAYAETWLTVANVNNAEAANKALLGTEDNKAFGAIRKNAIAGIQGTSSALPEATVPLVFGKV